MADDQIVIEIHSDTPDEVISNMEGGQYAKTENLRRDKEPETYDAIKWGTTAETSIATVKDIPITRIPGSQRMDGSAIPWITCQRQKQVG